MTTALKEIHIENSKKRDASVRFVSLIREKDPKLAYKGKSIKVGYKLTDDGKKNRINKLDGNVID